MHTKFQRLLSKSLTTLEVMTYYLVVHTGPGQDMETYPWQRSEEPRSDSQDSPTKAAADRARQRSRPWRHITERDLKSRGVTLKTAPPKQQQTEPDRGPAHGDIPLTEIWRAEEWPSRWPHQSSSRQSQTEVPPMETYHWQRSEEPRSDPQDGPTKAAADRARGPALSPHTPDGAGRTEQMNDYFCPAFVHNHDRWQWEETTHLTMGSEFRSLSFTFLQSIFATWWFSTCKHDTTILCRCWDNIQSCSRQIKPNKRKQTCQSYPSSKSIRSPPQVIHHKTNNKHSITPTSYPSQKNKHSLTPTSYPSQKNKHSLTPTSYPSQKNKHSITPTSYPSQKNKHSLTPTSYPSQKNKHSITPTSYPSQKNKHSLTPTSYPSQKNKHSITPTSYPSQKNKHSLTPTSYPSQKNKHSITPTSYPSQKNKHSLTPTSYPSQNKQPKQQSATIRITQPKSQQERKKNCSFNKSITILLV